MMYAELMGNYKKQRIKSPCGNKFDVELGTGPYFTPPPEWEEFDSPKGSGIGKGYVHARPFLRPAIEDHQEQLQRIAKNELDKE